MNRKIIRFIYSTMIISMMGIIMMGCTGSDENRVTNTISISGSTSVGPLMEKISEKYQEENPKISIEINQVGSSAGIKDAINGISQIGMSSRELKAEELDKVDETIIAYDGIALIVNKNNKVQDITLEQVRDIYTGKITNWNQLPGGEDKPIVVVSREEGSGTRTAFQEIVKYKSEEFKLDSIIASGNGNIKTTVEGNENAIGFVSFEYLDEDVNALKVEGVKPEADLVRAGEYKISRPFILATKKGENNEETIALIEYILSEDGQRIVKENKLIPVK